MFLKNRAAVCLMALLATQTSALAQNAAVTIAVDANAGRHPISPLIYGIAAGQTSVLSDLNCPLNRYGGNNTSRYNWQLNADNRGNDWYFESIGDQSSTPGERGDSYFAATSAAGAQLSMTIPTIGWVGKIDASRNKLSSFSIAKYGAQTGNDWQWFPDAGNGVLNSTGQNITGNDPNDANVPADSAFQLGFINHLISKWGMAKGGGVKYYTLDNEPSIWHSTHRDVHPTGATMAEVRDKMVDYATMIKTADPGALIVGPEEWGWSGYLYSGYDQQYGSIHGWSSLPDRNANGGWDYLPWILDQVRQKSAAAGVRLLDVFSVHYYPQGGEYSNDVSTSIQLLRNQSTRSLWDPNYVDQSWINSKVQLIPRLKGWVNSYYPGTQIGVTEYNWGAEGHINGATAQADIFGIFGREGLDMGTRWTYPDPSTPTYKAMKLYRNYDGQKSTFGDVSVAATVPNPDTLSAFASMRSGDGALTIVVISKVLSGTTPVTLSLANYQPGTSAQVWQLTSANAITRLADAALTGTTLSLSVPAQSISLLVIPAGSTNTSPAVPTGLAATPGNAQVSLSWLASAGATTYNVKRATVSGGPYTTIASGVAATSFTNSGLINGTVYYYVVSAVNSVGESANSAQVSATPQAPPLAPSALTATAISKSQIDLAWTNNTTGQDSVNIERSTDGATFTQVAVVSGSANKYSNTGLARLTTYYYRVRSHNTGGYSAYSSTVKAQTLKR